VSNDAFLQEDINFFVIRSLSAGGGKGRRDWSDHSTLGLSREVIRELGQLISSIQRRCNWIGAQWTVGRRTETAEVVRNQLIVILGQKKIVVVCA